MKEKDLFPGVKLFLEYIGLEVHGEVADIDVVGIGKTFDVAIEMKRRLSFELLDQVIRRKGRADYLFICIPKRKSVFPVSAKEILKLNKVGLIEIDIKRVNQYLESDHKDLFNNLQSMGVFVRFYGGRHNVGRRRRLKYYTSNLTAKQVGGVTSDEMFSPYKATIHNIKQFMSRAKHRTYHKEVGQGWVTVDDILTEVESHYSNPKPSIMATLQEEWNKDWIETKRFKNKRYFKFKGVFRNDL